MMIKHKKTCLLLRPALNNKYLLNCTRIFSYKKPPPSLPPPNPLHSSKLWCELGDGIGGGGLCPPPNPLHSSKLWCELGGRREGGGELMTDHAQTPGGRLTGSTLGFHRLVPRFARQLLKVVDSFRSINF